MKILYINNKKKFLNYNFFKIFGRIFFKLFFSHLKSEKLKSLPAPKHNELLIKVIACGVCSTDINKILNPEQVSILAKKLSRGQNKNYLGHEIVGVVVQVGLKSDNHYMGKKVAIIDINVCKSFNIFPECENCKKKRGVFCENKHKRTFNGDVYGGYSDYILRTVSQVLILDDNIDIKNAVLIEPLATAVHCSNFAKKNEKILINGLTTISVMLFRYLLHLGFDNSLISLYVLNDVEVNFAKKLGFEKIITDKTLLNNGEKFDRIYDFIGKQNGLKKFYQVLKNGGKLNIFGMENNKILMDSDYIINKELTISGIHGYSSKCIDGSYVADAEIAIELVTSQKILLNDLITDIYEFKNIKNKLIDICYSHVKKNSKYKVFFRTIFLRK